MEQKKIDNISISAIIKLYLYQKGIFVSDDFYDELGDSTYSGYRTTSGIFMKIGGTLSEEEFESLKTSGDLLADFPNITYEEYLRNREWATAQIFRKSSMTEEIKNSTYFELCFDNNGSFYISGQYVDSSGQKQAIRINDIGIFKQGNYDDSKAVAVQAGGIRIRDSLCGSNCISGCSFCSFGSGANNYREGTFTEGKLYEIKDDIKASVVQNGISALFITGGNPSLSDMKNWTYYLEESIKAFRQSTAEQGMDSSTVDVMLTPRSFDKYIDTKENYLAYLKYLKSLGVTTVSPNMEIWSDEKLQEYCKSNDKNKGTTKSEIGHDGYLSFIDASVEVMGKFNVRSALIVGLNTKDEIKEAIDVLINKGCYVTLSPFKAPECVQTDIRYSNNLKSLEPPIEDLIELSEYLKQRIKEYLQSLSEEERKICEANIDRSLNAHNSHNTSNLCSGQVLDKIEQDGLEQGLDRSIVTSINDFKKKQATSI
ncbi:MAG TPA: radical SAM protein [Bacilli bacterium]|nr:radical SAM protein [Bacilli bacterium]